MSIPSFRPSDEPAGVLAAIIDASNDAIIVKDLTGTILSWNAGAERLYGYAASEVVGRSLEVIMPPSTAGELGVILARVAAGERVENLETIRVTKDGHIVDVSLTVSPIRNAEGRVVGASGIGRNVTPHNRAMAELRESEERLRSLVESAVDGIIIIDGRGRVESVNPAVERLFGYRADELIGRNINVLMPSPYREEHDGYMARYLATGVARIIGVGREVTALRKDGTSFPVHLSVGQLSTPGGLKFTGILHDLTDRVKIEGKLREQAALVRLGEMAAVIAHEVKNPLAAVRGAIQVIGKRLPVGSREAAVITDVIARIDALNQLVKDLLLFARPPQPRPGLVDVASLLSMTASLLSQDVTHRDLDVRVAGEAPPIWADAELLKIVFLNLFINSAHAMKEKGTVEVTIVADAGYCRVAVSDSGPGIAPEIRERLFTPFVTTKSRGTGLGLSTVKRLLEAQAGQVSVTCPPEGGTTITIELPLAPEGPRKS